MNRKAKMILMEMTMLLPGGLFFYLSTQVEGGNGLEIIPMKFIIYSILTLLCVILFILYNSICVIRYFHRRYDSSSSAEKGK